MRNVILAFVRSKFNRKYQGNVKNIENNIVESLYRSHWPGNVRELKHFVQRLVLTTSRTDINNELIEQEMENLNWDDVKLNEDKSLQDYLSQQEEIHIQRILAKTNFKIIEASENLGIGRLSLFRKMKKYGIHIKYQKQGY